MADVTIRASYATVAEEDGQRFVGFVDDEDEGYALFRQPVGGGPVWFELNDEDLGAEDALILVTAGPKGLEVALKPALAPRFGWAGSVSIRAGAACDGRDAALEALRAMLGDLWRAAE
jgi:hypothetical protein